MVIFIGENGYENEKGEPITLDDIDAALDKGEPVAMSFGGEPVPVVRAEFIKE